MEKDDIINLEKKGLTRLKSTSHTYIIDVRWFAEYR